MTPAFRNVTIHSVVIAGRDTNNPSQKQRFMSWKNLMLRSSGIACETRLEAGYFFHE